MAKGRMVFWYEGPFESNEGGKEFETESSAIEEHAKKLIRELKETHLLFDFGITKLTQIKDSGEEIEVPITR